MDLNEFQTAATATDQAPASDDRGLVIPLLGLASESAGLLAQYKKFLRDGAAYRLFEEEVGEELGDVLWYLANIATKFGLDLQSIAEANLAKTRARFLDPDPGLLGYDLFDDGYPEHEKIPRRLEVELRDEVMSDGRHRCRMAINGSSVGDPLRDNATEEDGYRFHDVFHLALLAKLGWSPTLRGLMKRKRKSHPDIDEVEDGGRAQVIDEGIVAYAFDYGRRHDFLESVDSIDYSTLRTIKSLTEGLEVGRRSAREWEDAIVSGFRSGARSALRTEGGCRSI